MGKEIFDNTKMEKMSDFSSLLLSTFLEDQVSIQFLSHHCKCQQIANIVKSWVYEGDCSR